MELKPCPFCGGKAEMFEWRTKSGGILCCAAVCTKCGTNQRIEKTKKEAIAAWDNRTDGWIPASKRLPEEGDLVLAIKSDEEGDEYNVVSFENGIFELGYAEFFPDYWMPLPNKPEE